MSYYPTLAEDVERAKAILAEGRITGEEWVGDHREPLPGGTIYGKDIYAAYKLLERFVEAIEAFERRLADKDEELLKANEKVEALRGVAEQLPPLHEALVAAFYDPDPADPTPELDYARVNWLGVVADVRKQLDRLKERVGAAEADAERERLQREYDELHTAHRAALRRVRELEQRHARQALTIHEKTEAWRAAEADGERERLARRTVDEALHVATLFLREVAVALTGTEDWRGSVADVRELLHAHFERHAQLQAMVEAVGEKVCELALRAERERQERQLAAHLPAARSAYTCPRCGAVSYHPTDLAERYCGRCKQFEEPEKP